MPDSQTLFDALAGAGGTPINRPGMNAFVANSQAINGLRSAQTEDALQKAAQAQEEQQARSGMESAFTNTGMLPSDAHAATIAAIAAHGSAKDGFAALQEAQKAQNTRVLMDPTQLGQTSQLSAQQGLQGKVAEPVALPGNFTTLPGAPPVTPQQSPQGKAETAKTVAEAEEAHAKSTQATNPVGGLDPGALSDGARVVMADPTKMSQYAGFGKAGQQNKDQINNKISELLNNAGMTASDMIRQRALGKASVGAAGAAAKQAEVLDAFMPLVHSNGQRVLQLLSNVGDDGGNMPIIAGLQRSFGRNLGSDDLAELHSVITNYQQEVARLLASSPTMAGVISDKARGDIASIAPETATTNQMRRVVNRIDLETGIRRQGVADALAGAANAQLPVVPQASGANSPSAAPATAAPASSGAAPAAAAPMSLDDYLKSKGH